MAGLENQTFAGFEIISELGRGGMGAVYKARQPRLDRLVALKIMATELASDPDFVARFKREANAAASLNHENIVQVFSAGECEKTHYIAMEFVEGETLRAHIESQGKLDPREAVAVTVLVAQALQYAWNKARIIHRDIKPENIFLSKAGEVKVGDLGLAKTVGGGTTSLTQTGMMMGSPHYISPEQARGLSDIDFKTDIYSLGCTLYHMLTGRPPYTGTDPLVVINKHVNEPPPAIFKVWPTCPIPLALLVGKMLAKQRHERPASYEDLIEQLHEVHGKLKPATAVAPVSANEPTLVLTPTPASAQPTPKPAVTTPAPKPVAAKTPKPAPKARGSKPVTRDSRVLIGVGALAVVALIAGAMWWFVGRVPPRGETVSATTTAPGEGTGPTTASSDAALKQLGNVYKNAVGAEMVYIPPGEFMLGCTKEEQAWSVANGTGGKNQGEAPRKAVIKHGFWLGRTEVTVGQWKKFVEETGYVTDGEKQGESGAHARAGGSKKGVNWKNPDFGVELRDDHPATCISWNDAVAFCEWLTAREREAGRIAQGYTVRLPTEAEWEYACRAGTQTKFWWGEAREDGKGRLNWDGKGDGFEFVAPVDSFGERGRNQFGLADMLGNVFEWCLDGFDAAQAHEEFWAANRDRRILRGGSYNFTPAWCRCAFRTAYHASASARYHGFRVCLGPDVLGSVFTNAVGAEMVYIPPGEFMMGSTKEEQAWAVANRANAENVKSEGEAPRKTTIQQAFWMGRTEVTVSQWKQFVKATGYVTDAEKKGEAAVSQQGAIKYVMTRGKSWRDPNFGVEPQDSHPVCCISWNDAVAFCKWLTGREQEAGRIPTGMVVRLPTEAEWEYACRAGTRTKFWWGDSQEDGNGRLNDNRAAKFDGFQFVAPVDNYGARGRNPFGLADMSGNVEEWCMDGYDETQAPEVLRTSPTGRRTARGGAFQGTLIYNRCAARCSGGSAITAAAYRGFRVCLGPDVLGSAAAAVDDAFLREVAALPVEQQVARVLAELQRLNPGFDPAAAEVEQDVSLSRVRSLKLRVFNLRNISPLQALSKLEQLHVSGTENLRAPLADLSPLRGLKLTYFACDETEVADLSPLSGMPLKWVSLLRTRVTDLSPLAGLPLSGLRCVGAEIADFSPVKACPLTNITCDIQHDLSSLQTSPTLQTVSLPNRRTIPVAEYWRMVDAGQAWQNAMNLLPLIDPQKDAVKGTWTMENGELMGGDPWARVEIPYQPPPEYDFRIVFTQQAGDQAVWQILTGGGRSFDWCIAGFNGTWFGFEKIGGKGCDSNPSSVPMEQNLVRGRRYTSEVQIRKDGMRAFLDGRFITEWKTNYRDMSPWTDLQLRTERTLGVGATSWTIFHRIEVREVTGKGTFTRGAPVSSAAPITSHESRITSPDDWTTLPNGWRVGKPVNLGPGVNGAANDATPTVSADGLTLLFLSVRSGGRMNNGIWASTRPSTSAPWGVPQYLDDVINLRTQMWDPCLSSDGLKLIFVTKRPDGHGNYDLWMSTRNSLGAPWGKPENLGPFINSGDSETQPFITADGLTLVFRSDRPGGQGGADIWMSTRPKIGAPWSAPLNLGPPVNCEWEDARACLSSDSLTLFFASTRPGGQGKREIWMSTRRSKAEPFGQPVNMGATVNSSHEECAPWLSSDDRTLYFHSDRPGGQGENDLWQVPLLPPGATTPTPKAFASGALQHSNFPAPWLSAFCAEVAALPAEQQVARVAARLKELNPGFDGQIKTSLLDDPKWAGITFSARGIRDISPVRALAWLKEFTCSAESSHKSEFSDLSPLRGLRLQKVDCGWTRVSDLSPLRGMPLRTVILHSCPIRDFTPLAGGPIESLQVSAMGLQDLAPLRTLRLKNLNIRQNPISDLSPLRGMPLTVLNLRRTKVRDFAPLQGMALTWLDCLFTDVADLSPLRDAPLQTLNCEASVAAQPANARILRSIKTLEKINDLPPAEFWKQVEAGKLPQPAGKTDEPTQDRSSAIDDAFIREVAALPAEQQVARVVAKLKELNQGYDGQETHKIENGAVVYLKFSTVAVADISPVRALSGLRALSCRGERAPTGQVKQRGLVADLSALRGLRLEALFCSDNDIADLSPLIGMPLKDFESYHNRIADLGPLAGMPLCNLYLSHNQITDLSPLKGMALTQLMCNEPGVKDLSPLAGMPLKRVTLGNTKVTDLSPLRGMPLEVFFLSKSPISDLSPLAGMPLKELTCNFVPQRDTELLRSIKTLEKINNLPAAEFWKKVEAGEVPKP